MKFDINALEAAASATFDVVVGSRDDGSPVGFRVAGPSSDQYQKAEREIQVAVRLAYASTKIGEMDDDAQAELQVGVSERSRDIIATRCVIDIFGFTQGETEPLAFSAENLARIFRARPDWKMRVVAEVERQENFLPG